MCVLWFKQRANVSTTRAGTHAWEVSSQVSVYSLASDL